MERHDLLRDLLILFGSATLIAVVLHRVRQSTIVAYLLTGMLVGPFGLRLITNHEAIELMAEIGVVLLLFTIGVEFSLEKLVRLRRVVLGVGSRQVGLTILICLSIALLIGYPWRQSLFWGFLIATSSTALVLKLLVDRQELESTHGRTILGILLFQDLCVVPMMAVIPALAAPATTIALAILLALGRALVLMALVLLVAHYAFPLLWRHIVLLRNKEIFLLATIFFSLGTAWVSGALGLSVALGAFLAGMALSESQYAHQMISEILPFRDSFGSLFFISIGMLLNLEFARAEWMMVVFFAAGIIALKLLTGMTAALTLGFPLSMSLVVGLAVAQVGEFSFILLRQGAGLNLISESDYQTFLAAAVLTMMLTPLIIQFSPSMAAWLPDVHRLSRFFPRPDSTHPAQAPPLQDHVIICGYGLNGRLAADVLRQMGIPYLVLEMNPETVRSAAAQGQPILFGDGSQQSILQKAGVGQARAVVYAISDPFVLARAVSNARLVNPHLAIIARTKRLEDVPALERAGASQVVAEEMRAAEEIIIHLLGLFDVPRKRAFEKVQDARAQMKPTPVR